MKSIFAIGYGSEKREQKILEYLEEDYIISVILADVHFEWMLKRTILVMGKSRTKDLRKLLENTFKLSSNQTNSLQDIWSREIAPNYKNASIGTVLPNLTKIKNHAKLIRGFLVHGNGLAKKLDAKLAVQEYLKATQKLREFSLKNKKNIDEKLSARIRAKAQK